MLYRLGHVVLKPLSRVLYRPTIVGTFSVPTIVGRYSTRLRGFRTTCPSR